MDIENIAASLPIKTRAQVITAAGVLVLAIWFFWFRTSAPVAAESAPGAAVSPMGSASVGSAGAVNLGSLNLQSLTMPGYSADTSGLMASLQSALSSASSATAAMSAPIGDGNENLFPMFGYGVPGQSAPRAGVPTQTVSAAPAYVAAKVMDTPRIAAAPKQQQSTAPSFSTVIDPASQMKFQVASSEAVKKQSELNAAYWSRPNYSVWRF